MCIRDRGNEGLTRSFAIYDENDQQAIVKQVMRRMGIDTKQLTPRTVLGLSLIHISMRLMPISARSILPNARVRFPECG